MPTFEFQGRDVSGKLIAGLRLASSVDNISAQLLKEGIIPVQIKPVKTEENAWKIVVDFLQGGRISTDEMGIFARQMYTLCKTGVPISLAIKRLAETARSARMTTALNGIAESLESGLDLAASMQRYPQVFTPVMISMIRVGQSSGRLEEAFLHLNQYIELEASAVKRLATATRYPLFILISMVVAIFVVNTFVIPTFARVYENAHISLPGLTVALITISKFTRDYWFYILVALVFSSAWTVHFLKTPQGKLKWDRLKLRIPVIGSIFKRIVLLRFTQIFGIVTNAGVPLLEGLTLVAQAVNNKYAEQEILEMRETILRGKSLTQAALAVDFFTPLEIQMLTVSEETGELGDMLQQMSTFYEREVDYDLKRLNDFIEPILIVCLSIVILMLAFAVYLPIWDLIKLAHA
jgi:MSHA biogenesis protein MshG